MQTQGWMRVGSVELGDRLVVSGSRGVGCENLFLKSRPEIGTYGMRYILIFPSIRPSARHGDEDAVFPLDDLDIVHHEAFIEGDGDIRLQFSFSRNLADSDVRNFHSKDAPFVYTATWVDSSLV
ncbi:hypothetical protein TRIP_E380010 [uncultured Spirochaetota bacterium]|uniref:Uncharacterized protein n=1 Tax=uncultured Spirochaetota bacterium TaxID=460511 RepID=A0A652ZYM9_9SPIR|nr:hypothetical protein TRIP_E380010 [uncultured Spirochaetota bacterium]